MKSKVHLEDIIEKLNKEGQAGDFSALLNECEKNDIKISFEDIYKFNRNTPNKFASFITPNVVKNFIARYTKHKELVKVLDPWCHFGEILDSLSIKAESLTGINPNSTELGIAQKLLDNEKFQLLQGNAIEILEDHGELYDLVVSAPPFNYKRNTVSYDSIEISDYGSNLIIKSLLKLNDGGNGLFIVPPSFFHRSNMLLKVLEKESFFIDAAFHIPPGTLPNTSIPSYLVSIGRRNHEKIFIAQLKEEANLETIITNWKKRISGKILSLGHLIELSSFKTYEKVEIDLEIDRFASKSNLKVIGLDEIALEINQSARGIEDSFNETINCIYIPRNNLSDVVSDLSDIRSKPSNFIQVVLDSKSVSAVYLANWFNSQLGLLVRKSLLKGGASQRLTIKDLSFASLYLPTDDRVQEGAVNIQSRIDSLRTELNSLEGRLWKAPNSYNDIARSLRSLNRDEGVEQWMEKLPFPLASILWKYHATKDQKDKKEFLMYFFEALAQFTTVLLFSAYNSDDEFLVKQNFEFDIDKIMRSTFGSWTIIGEQLAKNTRRLMSDKNDKELCLRLFKHKRSDLIEVFTSKKLYHVLNRTKQYRNDWKGHGGIEGTRETARRLQLLKSELNKVRDIIGDVFEDYKLIKPGEGRFEDGIYNCRCFQITGTRSTFKERIVKVNMGLDVRDLYLIENENVEALKLLPFIKLMPSPSTEENACYFYNRVEGDRVRMISYYFDRESDISIQEDNLQTFIQNLRRG